MATYCTFCGNELLGGAYCKCRGIMEASREVTHSEGCWSWHPTCAQDRVRKALAWLDRSLDEIDAGSGPTATTVVKHTRRILRGMP